MPFEMFDTSKLITKPINQRIHDVNLLQVLIPVDNSPPPLQQPNIKAVANALVAAKQNKAASILMYGGHVIRTGCSLYMIELMKRGLVNHFATNGSGSIHDFEFSLKIGRASCWERV